MFSVENRCPKDKERKNDIIPHIKIDGESSHHEALAWKLYFSLHSWLLNHSFMCLVLSSHVWFVKKIEEKYQGKKKLKRKIKRKKNEEILKNN